MTHRPVPARAVRRRQWTLPFARALGRAAAADDTAREARPPAAAPLNRDEDFLRRLREAGL